MVRLKSSPALHPSTSQSHLEPYKLQAGPLSPHLSSGMGEEETGPIHT